MANEEEYLALISEDTPERRATRLKCRLAELEHRSNVHTKLFFGFLERDVVMVAGEILKWSVKKCGETDGEARHLFDTSPDVQRMLGCRAYGEFGSNPDKRGVEAFKALSHVVVKARNDTAHFQDLQALDAIVRSCTVAISEWPQLEAKYPMQVKIILKYKESKRLLPDCFQ